MFQSRIVTFGRVEGEKEEKRFDRDRKSGILFIRKKGLIKEE